MQSKVSLQVEIIAPEMGTIQSAVAPLDANSRKRKYNNLYKRLTDNDNVLKILCWIKLTAKNSYTGKKDVFHVRKTEEKIYDKENEIIENLNFFSIYKKLN